MSEIPPSIVQHIRISLRLSADLMLGYENDRTLRRYQASILQYLGLKPSHGREARKTAIAAAEEASQTMTNTADLINTVVERLRTERCELPSFETLNRLVHRVRRVVHQQVFRQVLERLAQTDKQRLDDLLKTTEIVQRQSAFQDLKEAPAALRRAPYSAHGRPR